MAGRPKRTQDLAVLASDAELGDRIIEMLGEGKQLARICEATGISKAALLEWLEEDPERAALASRARARAATALVDEARAIADDVDADHPGELNKAKLRIGVRQWTAERWNRAAYGQQNKAEVTINLHAMHLDALRTRTAGPGGEVSGIIDVTPKGPSQAELDEL